ncbi:POT family MFS transporter [Luteolibacter ambystomatis]|uniref:POT family MFS transporter n=1 Tax=Luteolibacter ambystomatis TaxID=2824561 RepID=A0A975IYH3_9BACT|nr:POT family MFS transporter [Luteolibacter ambystomatis]QUE49888.1 POT family MFS transporter [Luteolibacter ambystomatis]
MSYRTTAIDTDKMPPGIPYIIGNEAAERFSFYGMRAVLVMFMAQYLHLMDKVPGHAMSNPEAVERYHLFASFVYFTPLLGALLADIFFGKYNTILWLSIVYCLGHAALACMGSFGFSGWWLFAGLGLICLGAGGIKSCVSAHVGDQFGKSNHHLITRIYNWFYFSINFGSFFSTMLTPTLLAKYGPHWAFGVPGVLMAIATFMFWMGRNKFVHIPAGGWKFVEESFSREGLIALGKLIPLFALISVFWSLYDQTGSSWVLQATSLDLKPFSFLDWTVQASAVQAINPILILIYIPLFTLVIYPWMNRIFRLTPLRKIGCGLFLMAAAFGIVTLTQTWIDGGQRPSIHWQLLAYYVITASEVMVAIVGLEFAYTQAPKTMKSWVMGLFWLSVFGGNQFTAQVNHYIAIPSASQKQFDVATAALPADMQTSPRNIVLPGYDGVVGTDDDIIARSKQGALDSIEIPGRQTYLDAAAKIETQSGVKFPSKEEGAALLSGMKDQWGNSFRYDVIDSSTARIASAGPTRQDHTEWEMGLMIERPKPKEDHPWLDKRKQELGVTEAPMVAGFAHTEFCGGQSKLEGAAYFRFFTLLVLGTAVLFIPFAMLYRPKSYLQDDVESEEHPGPDAVAH